MKIEVRESVELKLGGKTIQLSRAEAVELIEALQNELGIPEKVVYVDLYPYQYWPLPTVTPYVRNDIFPVWSDTTGTITSASTLGPGEVMTFDGPTQSLKVIKQGA